MLKYGKAKQLDAVIFTALLVEYEAVRVHLTNIINEEHPAGTNYERGIFSDKGRIWEIGIVQIEPGNSSAAMEAERAINFFNPRVALFVGIAGGIKDVAIGDVVAATKVYEYDSGKAKEIFEPRPDVGNSTYSLIQRARVVIRKREWLRRINDATSEMPPSRAFTGAIAAGEKVVASKNSAIFEFLKLQYGDALAVEMEGRGFLKATHANEHVAALVIRGISDLLDNKSATDAAGSQLIAARNASAFAFEVLASLKVDGRDEPRNIVSQSDDHIWNVSLHSNPNFTGRERLLAELRAGLLKQEHIKHPQILHGMGGVGKTQLAAEYAYRHATDYSIVWWVRAEEQQLLESDYAQLARRLNLPGRESRNQQEMVEAVRRWLGQNAEWLLVFDNAGHPGELRRYLPQGGQGHVIITSRNPNWRNIGHPISVPVLTRAWAVHFLLQRTGQTEQEAAAALANELGDLPLALEQAGAYVEATGNSLSDYLELFRTHQHELLKLYPPSPDYPMSVAVTWDISFRQLSDAAAALLQLCAFLSPERIPTQIFREGKQHVPDILARETTDSMKRDLIVADLRRYSLVDNMENDALSFHRLVQLVTRNRLSDDEKRRWSEIAVNLMEASFPAEGFKRHAWPTSERLVSHALAASERAEHYGVPSEAAARLLHRAGLYLQERALLASAEQAFERALKIVERMNGRDDREAISIINHLSGIAMARGNWTQARSFYQRALFSAQKVYGEEHPETASAISGLGSVFHGEGDLATAQIYYERALAIDKKHYGSNHPKVVHDLDTLGVLLMMKGSWGKAKDLFEQGIEIKRLLNEPDPAHDADAASNLGFVLHSMGDLAGARSYFEQALIINKEIYGSNHFKVAHNAGNLGSVLMELGEFKEARDFFEQTLTISIAVYDPQDLEVAYAFKDLGNVLVELDEAEKAVSYLRRALEIFRLKHGDNHKETLRVRSRLNMLGQ